MSPGPFFLMTDPNFFEVSYQINPWMQPRAWSPRAHAAAQAASTQLHAAIKAAGAQVEFVGAVHGLPDLVFPANAAVVLDGRVLVARFRHPERQGEQAVFRAAFKHLQARGLVREIVELPDGITQEGAGDAIWDGSRGLFWVGHGPRSNAASVEVVGRVFGRAVVPLELACERYYHLDTCFCPLSGGQVFYYPPAFTPRTLEAIRERLSLSDRIEATPEEAQAFCVNAVNLEDHVIMARAPKTLRTKLAAHGYRLTEIDLDPFLLSGGAAYCMTLRLDRTSASHPLILAAE